MNVLFISKNLIAADLCKTLIQEGVSLKLFIENKKDKRSFDGIIPKTNNWRKELDWVGHDGIIIFDDHGYGKEQDELRRQGYQVIGGTEITDTLESDREFAQQLFHQYGLPTRDLKNFTSLRDAITYITKNPKRWVVKQNTSEHKDLTYIGMMHNGHDVVAYLESFLDSSDKITDQVITLHEFVDGVEIGVGRYFNGNDWVGPVEINLEHKRFFPGNIGPITSEMGTLAWYTEHEGYLFQKVLTPWKEFLQKVNFKGDFEINCIVNEQGIIPLEVTPRFGSPIIHLQETMHTSPWSEFFLALAQGRSYDLTWKQGYGIVVLLAVPPFPYSVQKNNKHPMQIFFSGNPETLHTQIHFEEIAKTNDQYHIVGTSGYVAYVTAIADTVPIAQQEIMTTIQKIHIPRVMYRNDIGTDFYERQCSELINWGILSRKDLPKTKKKFWFI